MLKILLFYFYYFYYTKVQNLSLTLIYHIIITSPERHNNHTCGIYMMQFCKVKRKNASPNCELRIQLPLLELQRVFYRIIATMRCCKFGYVNSVVNSVYC